MSSEKDSLYIFELLTSYFTARQFQSIPTNISTVSMYATYQKSSLYLINIIILGNEYVFDESGYKAYRETTRHQFSRAKTDKVILLNIMITEKPENVYEFVNHRPNLDEDFVDIHWIVDSSKKELVIPSLQLKSVLGFEKAIQELVTTGIHEFYALTQVREQSYISFFFIFLITGIWVFLEYQGGSTDVNVLMKYGAMNVGYMISTHQYWRLFTSMFLHIGFAHLAFNVFALYIFGSRLEKYVSAVRFGIIYIFSGLVGAICSFGVSYLTGKNTVAAGASGAIYGLLAAVLVLSNASKRPIEGLSSYTIWLVFIFGIVYSVLNRNIDAMAHVGGFIGGLIITFPIIQLEKMQLGGKTNEKR